MKLFELAEKIDGTLEGDGEIEIRGVDAIHEAGSDEISFLSNPKYAPLAGSTEAGAVIVDEDWDSDCPAALIRSKNPDAAFAQAASLFYTSPPAPKPGIHPTAVVADNVELGEGVSIGPQCVVEADAKIAANSVISAQCYIGRGVSVGSGCFFHPQVSVREAVVIGDRTVIHNGTVLGSDGFGYSVDENGVRTKIPQIGIVQVGNDVEIGANVTVDRARFGKTSIGNGTKIDNLVQIAHNVTIGQNVVIVAQVGIAGSSSIGDRTVIAGQAAVAGHVRVGSDVIVGGQAAVIKDIESGQYVMGAPAVPAKTFKKNLASVVLLPKLKERVVALEKEVRRLTEQRGG